MILTIFGSTGEVGKELVNQAVHDGHEVRAFGRNVFTAGFADNAALQLLNGAVFDKTQVLKAITGADAVLSAMTSNGNGVDHTLSLGIKNIITQMGKARVKRIVALGHSGVLNVSNENGELLMDQESFPPPLIPVALENFKAYQSLKLSDLNWTLLCPAEVREDSPTGNFRTASQVFPAVFPSEVSTGDIALFMLGELRHDEYVNCRVGISK